MYLLGVLFMVVAIGLSIALHEIGHLVPAKRFGVLCRQYMIGFGPTLWSRKVGDTEYGIKAIPLGGYVRMIGMYPPGKDAQAAQAAGSDAAPAAVAPASGEPGEQGSGAGSKVAVPAGAPAAAGAAGAGGAAPGAPAAATRRRRAPWTALIEEARQASLEEIGPGEEDRVFYKLSTPKKLIVMFGGPFMNLVIAAVVLTVVYTVIGVPQAVGAQVSSVAECVRPVTSASADANQAPCTAADEPSPAAAAGIRPGDQVLSIDGKPISSIADIARAVRPAAGRTIGIVVRRDGQEITLTARPITADMPALDGSGQVATGPSGQPQTVRAGYLGMNSRDITAPVTRPVTEVPVALRDGVAQTASVVVQLPAKLVGVYQAAFGGQARDETGPVSVVGVGRLAGEVADGQVAWARDTRSMVLTLLLLVASLNIALFVFNLIPLVPLDGGHIAGAAWEGSKRVFARITRRPDPGYVDVARAMPLAYGMTLVLLAMGALLIYADIVAPLKL